MNDHAAVAETKQRDIALEIDPECAPGKRNQCDIVGKLSPCGLAAHFAPALVVSTHRALDSLRFTDHARDSDNVKCFKYDPDF
jgi:hypothetical protein